MPHYYFVPKRLEGGCRKIFMSSQKCRSKFHRHCSAAWRTETHSCVITYYLWRSLGDSCPEDEVTVSHMAGGLCERREERRDVVIQASRADQWLEKTGKSYRKEEASESHAIISLLWVIMVQGHVLAPSLTSLPSSGPRKICIWCYISNLGSMTNQDQ